MNKIKMLRSVDIDVDKPRLQEVWPKYLSKNDILSIDRIEAVTNKHVNVVLDNGDVLLDVPSDSFDYVSEYKSVNILAESC